MLCARFVNVCVLGQKLSKTPEKYLTGQPLSNKKLFGLQGLGDAGEQVELWPPETPMGENSYHQCPPCCQTSPPCSITL